MEDLENLEDSEGEDELLEEDTSSFEELVYNAVWSKYLGNSNSELDRPSIQTPNALMRSEGGFRGLYYEQKSKAVMQFLMEALDSNIFLNHWTKSQKTKLAKSMTKGKFFNDQVVVSAGKVGYSFYVVEDGMLTRSRKGGDLTICGKYHSFGEVSLLFDYGSYYNYKAETLCAVWKVDRNTFLTISKENSQEILERNLSAIRQFEISAKMAQAEILGILDDALYVIFHRNDPIYDEDDKYKLFYIILVGEVSIVPSSLDTGKRARNLTSGEFFGYIPSGEEEDNEGGLKKERATAVTDCELLVLNRPLFDKYFDAHRHLFKPSV